MDADTTPAQGATASTATDTPAAADPAPAPAGAAARFPISFDTHSVARSTSVVLALVAAFMLVLWLFGVVGHFIFLLLLAWLFAAAMEPGIDWFVRHGRGRGLAASLTGCAIVLVSLVLVAVFGDRSCCPRTGG